MRLTWLSGFAVGAVAVGGIILLVTIFTPPDRVVSWPMDAQFAGILLERCDTTNLNTRFTKAPPDPNRLGIHAYARNGNIDSSLGTLVNRGYLVGVIVNDNVSKTDKWNDNWTEGPQGLTCIFMGGNQDGVWAKVVYRYGAENLSQGWYREVAARFNRLRHSDNQSEWDRPVDATYAPDSTLSAHGGQESSLVPDVYQESDSVPQQIVLFIRDENERKFRVDVNPGPWFTCSSNTCCKAI
jgi:hypothetical protein